jgi:glucokinase
MLLDYRRWNVDHGEQGFLESVTGADAIAKEGMRLRRRGPAAVMSGDHAAAVFEAARGGDRRSEAVVQQIAVYLGATVANIAAVLDPALVVFGGGISHVGEQLLQPVREVVARIVPNVPEIRVSAAGDDAQVYGSLYSALQLADVRLFESL